ncbi:MAG TPA: protein kinase [Bryobacteraceae bacterium]|nr:protein kinase [Bryobacteraceae bacterium]
MTAPERIGPYKINRKLGEGGMGVVYSAHDVRLERNVALKMIRDPLCDESSRRRFLREGQSAARVNHPNICQLYDVGEEQGRPYLVMELLDGESLAERLARGPLVIPEAVQVILAVLSALATLHRNSILHRDLKPSNIFLSVHGVKLLDFGLAKGIRPESSSGGQTQTEITERGMIVATPRYASPEQVTGGPLDARSDLFAAGVILFEMATGRQAFAGQTPIEVFHAILHDEPPALGGSPAAPVLDRIVRRALAKEPQNRYASAEEMAADLREVSRLLDSGAQVEVRAAKRLIVLPFRILRSDPDTDFLAFSLPDAIAASLAGLSSLVVRSTLIGSRFADPSVDLKAIARDADVDVVLAGTLLRAGSQLRLSTQLVEAAGGTLIWSRTLQVELRDLFQVHDTLVSGVVDSLALPLTAGEHRRLAHDAPADASAYDFYLRANELARSLEEISAARDLYEKCVAKDPTFAPAWAQLGRARWLSDKYSAGSVEQLAAAEEAFQKAFDLDPDLPLAHNLYSQVQVEQGRAMEALKRLLERARSTRNDPELFAGLTHACRYCGLLQASQAAHRQARRLDRNIATSVVHTYFLMGDYESALDASHADFGFATAISLAMLGRTEQAIKILAEKEASTKGRLGRLYLASLRSALLGQRDEALAVADEQLAASFRDPEGWYYLARLLGYLNEPDRALRALQRTVDWGFFCFPAMTSDPWLKALRGERRFDAILSQAEERHREANDAFTALGGPALLGCAG